MTLTYEQALHRAATLCTASEKCISEIQEKLTAWGIDEAESEKLLLYLIKENYLDENRFTSAFVRDKFRFNKWGKIKIAYALKHKGISSSMIKTAMEEIEDDAYLNLLTDILKTKLKGLKFKDEYDRKAKLFRFALSRGFESDVVGRALKGL